MAKKIAQKPKDPTKGKNLMIMHSQVGEFEQGRVVARDAFPEEELERLFKVGAIVGTDEDVSPEPVPPNPENRGVTEPPTTEETRPNVDKTAKAVAKKAEEEDDEDDEDEDSDEEDEDSDDEDDDEDEDEDEDDEDEDDEEDEKPASKTPPKTGLIKKKSPAPKGASKKK